MRMSIRLIGEYTRHMVQLEAEQRLEDYEMLCMSQAADADARREYLRLLQKRLGPRKAISGLDAVASFFESLPRG